jgi:hypothetical protein
MPSDIAIPIGAIHENIDPDDNVYLVSEDRSMSARQLLDYLTHPSATGLFNRTQNTTIQVCYWTLFDLRDCEKDGDLTKEERDSTISLTSDGRREQPLSDLTDEESQQLRTALLSIKNLLVWFDTTDVLNCCDYMRAAYVGTIRTFPNISYLHYGWWDKYGWHVKEHIATCWERWGAKTAKIVRLHGSDDNCGLGEWSDTHGYLEACQGGTEFGETWREIAETMPANFRDLTHYLSLSSLVLEAKVGTPDLKSMAEFSQLRTARMWVTLLLRDGDMIIHEKSGEHYWVLDVPAMPWLTSFEMNVDKVRFCNKSTHKNPIIIFRFAETPNLKSVVIRFEGGSKKLQHMRGVLVSPGKPWEWFSQEKELTSSGWDGWFEWMLAGVYNQGTDKN